MNVKVLNELENFAYTNLPKEDYIKEIEDLIEIFENDSSIDDLLHKNVLISQIRIWGFIGGTQNSQLAIKALLMNVKYNSKWTTLDSNEKVTIIKQVFTSFPGNLYCWEGIQKYVLPTINSIFTTINGS